MRITVIEGDITRQPVDVIVNAANRSLLGGGGVDGAVHRAAGPGLVAECRTLGGCETGEARLTRAYRLPARWVVHTVGPVWQGGSRDEDHLLASAYRRSLEVARAAGARTIAFPAISTGAYAFPPERAAVIVVVTVAAFQAGRDPFDEVRLVCFDAHVAALYRQALANLPARTRESCQRT